jgi:hypothetical protein
MKFPDIFEDVAALAWLGVSLVATPAVTAQTIISNETLVSTTLIVNTKDAKAICRTTGCRAKTALFAPINVTCPAATGKTCTFTFSWTRRLRSATFVTGAREAGRLLPVLG